MADGGPRVGLDPTEAPVDCVVRVWPNEEVGRKGLNVEAGLRGTGWKGCGEVGEAVLLANGSLSKGLGNGADPPVVAEVGEALVERVRRRRLVQRDHRQQTLLAVLLAEVPGQKSVLV